MKLKVLIGAVLLLATPFAARAEVIYRLTSVMQAGQLQALRVEMRFPANADGITDVQLPNRYRGEKDLYKNLKDLQIAGASEIETPTPDVRRLHAKPGAQIVVSYRLDANLKAGVTPPEAMASLPIIATNGFHIFGPDLFAYPDKRRHEVARFESDLPAPWRLAVSATGPDLKVKDVVLSVLLGSPSLNIVHYKIGASDLTVANTGHFQLDMAEMNDKIIRAMKAENAFWGDGPSSFLITLSEIDAGKAAQSYTGTGVSHGFDVMATKTVPPEMLLIYNAHEYFHNWNPRALGGPEPGENTGYWFSEGLTDYYSRKLSLRAGLIDLKTYVNAWNEALNRYAASPDRAASNRQVADDFWKGEDVNHMDYDRGSILAAQWNADWRAKGVTLDQFMHAMKAAAAKPDFAKLSFVDRVIQVMDGFGIDERGDLQQHITDGAPILLTPNAMGGCLKVATEQMPVLDRGYDADKSGQTGVFTGVDPASNAYKAGLRDGMTYLERLSGDPEDSAIPYSFRVKTPDGKEEVITYLPQGKMTYDRQRVEIPGGLSATELKACTAAVAVF